MIQPVSLSYVVYNIVCGMTAGWGLAVFILCLSYKYALCQTIFSILFALIRQFYVSLQPKLRML